MTRSTPYSPLALLVSERRVRVKEERVASFQLHGRGGKLVSGTPQRQTLCSIQNTPPRPTTIAGQCPALWISTSSVGLASPHQRGVLVPPVHIRRKKAVDVGDNLAERQDMFN